jgi:hypothetical protein
MSVDASRGLTEAIDELKKELALSIDGMVELLDNFSASIGASVS